MCVKYGICRRDITVMTALCYVSATCFSAQASLSYHIRLYYYMSHMMLIIYHEAKLGLTVCHIFIHEWCNYCDMNARTLSSFFVIDIFDLSKLLFKSKKAIEWFKKVLGSSYEPPQTLLAPTSAITVETSYVQDPTRLSLGGLGCRLVQPEVLLPVALGLGGKTTGVHP